MRNLRKIKGLEQPDLSLIGLVRRDSLAFLRGYLEGIELTKLQALYFDRGLTSTGSMSGTQRLDAIRKDLLRFVSADGPSVREVKLLWIDPQNLKSQDQPPSMSFEEFRHERDPEGFYWETELLEMYRDEVGDARTGDRLRVRNERLRRRQASVLRLIELKLPPPPSMVDPLSKWMPSALARGFGGVRVHTVGDLSQYISDVGHAWWKKVPRVGAVRARLIEEWVVSMPVKEGPVSLWPIPLHVQRSSTPNTIAPWELLKVPEWLESEFGRLKQGLAAYQQHAASSTFLAYRRALERFVLFCVFEMPVGTSLYGELALKSFVDFLRDLGRTSDSEWQFKLTQQQWIGPRHSERTTAAWRPFAGPLGPAAQRLAYESVRAILSNICRQNNDS